MEGLAETGNLITILYAMQTQLVLAQAITTRPVVVMVLHARIISVVITTIGKPAWMKFRLPPLIRSSLKIQNPRV